VSTAVLLVLFSLGPGFELVEDGGESESLCSEVEPAQFPDTLVPGDPARCPACSGVPGNVWDREVRQHQYMQVGREFSNVLRRRFGRCERWRW